MSSEIQIWEAKEPWANPHCTLGEGPAHEESTGKLRFLDIESNQVLWLNPKGDPSSLERMNVKDAVGVTADIEGDSENIIVGAKYGYAYMSLETGELTYITKPSQFWSSSSDEGGKAERMRFNDGNIDPQGRFWCGMVNDPSPFKPEGALFVLDPTDNMNVRRVVDNVSISNGIGWSEDGRTMYFTDSPTRTIVAYDFDGARGTIRNKRVWYDCRDTEADDGVFPVPDGFCQDDEGGFWVALFGAWKVVRLKDVNGRAVKVGEVRLPARRITCPRIIDKTLWVTTAAEVEGKEYSADAKKYGGAVYAVPVGFAEKRMNKWKKPKSHI